MNLLDTFTDPAAAGREYVFAERNWHDYDDHSRAVRTVHFKYIRNGFPNRRLAHSADSVTQPLFQKMRTMRDAGTLTREQMLSFRSFRAPEELYALDSDPNEFRNLAADPAHAPVLERLRNRLDRWIAETDDAFPEKALPDEFDLETGQRIRPPHQLKKK